MNTAFEIRMFTYNVNGVPAHSFKLPDLLRVLQTLNDSLPIPHIFVMGFQEIVDLTPGKVLNNAASDIALVCGSMCAYMCVFEV